MSSARPYNWLFPTLTALVGFVSLPMASSEAATPETELAFVLNSDAAIHPFVANYGQDDAAVQFAARSYGGTFFIRDADLAIALAADDGRRASTAIQFTGVGTLDASPGEASTAAANFYLGADPGAWLEDLPTHADVDLLAIQPGVDMQIDASGRDVRWSIDAVLPTALPTLCWSYTDAISVELTAQGDLAVELQAFDEQGTAIAGETRALLIPKPRAWQVGKGGGLVPRDASFVIEAGEVHVELVGSFTSRPVLVELMTRYSERRGAADSFRAGEAIWAQGSAEPTVAGSPGDDTTDMMSLRFDAAGQQITAVTVVGGDAHTIGGGLGAGKNGRVWLTGTTWAQDFPTFAAVQYAPAGGSEAVLVELDQNGHLLSSSYYGGSGDDEGDDVEVDPNGVVWLAGKAEVAPEGPGLDLGFGTSFSDGAGYYNDFFVVAIDGSGLDVKGTTCFGGNTPSGDPTVTVDPNGAVSIGVRTDSTSSSTSFVTYTDNAPHTGPACDPYLPNGWGIEALCWKHNISGVAYTPQNVTSLILTSEILSFTDHTELNAAHHNTSIFASDPGGEWEGAWGGWYADNMADSGEEITIAAALYMYRWGSPVYANGLTPAAPVFYYPAEAFGIHSVTFDTANDPATNCQWAGFYDTSFPGYANYPIYQVATNCTAFSNLSIHDTEISYWDHNTQPAGYVPSYWTGPGASWWWDLPSNANWYSQVYIGDPPVEEAFMTDHIDEYASLLAADVVEDMQIARTWYEGGVAVSESVAVERTHVR